MAGPVERKNEEIHNDNNLCVCFSSNANAQTGTEQVRKYFKIEKTKPVDEFVVRDATLKIAPMDTELKEVIARLERNGIKYGETCAPGDITHSRRRH